MPFEKGKVYNPKGRPKVVRQLETQIRRHSMHAVARMGNLINSQDERIALAASQYFIDRVMGKAKATVEVSGEVSLTHQHLAVVQELGRKLQDEVKHTIEHQDQPEPNLISDESKDQAKLAFVEKKKINQPPPMQRKSLAR